MTCVCRPTSFSPPRLSGMRHLTTSFSLLFPSYIYDQTAFVEVVSNVLVNMLSQSQPLCFEPQVLQFLSPKFQFALAFLFDTSKLLVCSFHDGVCVFLALHMAAEGEEENVIPLVSNFHSKVLRK